MIKFARYIFTLLILHSMVPQLKASNGKSNETKFFTDSLTHAISKNIIYPYYQLTYINDLNPVLGQISNDDGYTFGYAHRLRILANDKQRFYDLSISSDLYTQYLYKQGYSQEGKWIIPQNFTEINTISFSFNQYIESKKLFAGLEIGSGIRNKNHPIWGFALYLQGGEDGLGGYHSNLEMHANENLATGEIKPFIYLTPSIRKLFVHENKNEYKDPFYIDLHTGFSLGTSQIKSSAFLNVFSELPIFQLVNTRRSTFKVSGLFNNLLFAHSSGVQYNPEIGLEFEIFFVSIGYSSIFYFGQQNEKVIDYYDYESSMRGYVRMNF